MVEDGIPSASFPKSKDRVSKLDVIREKFRSHISWYNGFFAVVGLILTVLLIGGTFAYHYLDDWPLSTSFYYTVQTLFVVGYGVPVEDNDYSYIFSVVLILLGSFIIAGVIGEMVAMNVRKGINKTFVTLCTMFVMSLCTIHKNYFLSLTNPLQPLARCPCATTSRTKKSSTTQLRSKTSTVNGKTGEAHTKFILCLPFCFYG